MKTADTIEELRATVRRLHESLNKWPHNTPEGREMRSHFGKRIETVQRQLSAMEKVRERRC